MPQVISGRGDLKPLRANIVSGGDNLIQCKITFTPHLPTGAGLLLDLPKNKIFASIYTPYIYITTTFFCPTAGCDQRKKSLLKIKPCKRQCQRYVFKLRQRTMPKLIYLKGNTQFYKNTQSQFKEWQNLGVDRIVYEPEIPI